ncbi:hypothetical protein EDB19DRAFT_115898 [Suillus lakei]|nr:hypothetical protein EDB19DRAFT_115898 [Suillus lakei]
MTNLQGAQLLYDTLSSSNSGSVSVPGLLNFGDATSPGGGFLIGLPTQEETIARLSTLYLFLMAYTAQQFYNLHHRDEKGGFYHHAFVYTPAVVVMRNDAGEWASPYDVDVLTSAAVNVGAVRREIGESVAHEGTERQIEVTMRERMARILFLFEEHESKESHFGKLWNGSVQK